MVVPPYWRIALAALAAVHVGACRHDPLPDLPPIRTEGFSDPARTLLEPALEAARRKPSDAVLNGRLGMVLHAYGRPDAAAVAYLRAHKLDPNSFRWIYYLALAQQDQAKPAEALGSLRLALRLRPNYQPGRLRLAELLLETGDLQAAASAFQELATSTGDIAAAHYGLGRARSASGDLPGAVAAWNRACQLQPAFAAAHHALARAYRRMGRIVDAEIHEAAHARSQGAAPSHDPLEREIHALNPGPQNELIRGVELASEGRFAEAAAAHERALQADPKLMRARINLISIYARLRRPELAEAHYRDAVHRNPDEPEAHYNFGVMLFEQGRLREAKRAFELATKANPNHSDSHDNLGYLLMIAGDRASAEAHFRTALKFDPAHRLARFHLAQLLVGRRSYTNAIRHLSQILQPEDERTPGFTHALAAAYARLGRTREALQLARTARAKAERFGQTDLIVSIDRDIRALERRR